jgi:Mn-dependent DtxR family transcriptional regulator
MAIGDRELSPSLEDYLRKICELASDGFVRSNAVARELGVSRPSMHDAASRLREAGLLEAGEYSPLEPSKEGMELGATLIERRRLVDLILEEAARNGAADAREEACAIEHAMSIETAHVLASLIAEANVVLANMPSPRS